MGIMSRPPFFKALLQDAQDFLQPKTGAAGEAQQNLVDDLAVERYARI